MSAASLILGGPGTGKTTRLLREVTDFFAAGGRPSEVAFVSFTRAAVREARLRAPADTELPHFRTIHSLAYTALGLKRGEMMDRERYRDLSELTGEELSDRSDPLAPAISTPGDELLFLDQAARAAQRSLEDVWHEHDETIDWHRLQRFTRAYAQYRADLNLSDYADLLERYVMRGVPLAVRLAIVDEGQDLTAVQWAVIERAFGGVERLIVAGDDKQSVHRWAGAAVDTFLNLPYPVEVLPLSHRVPKNVFSLATEVGSRIERARPNPWLPTDRAGELHYLAHPEEADLSQGEWLVLVRARSQLKELVELARHLGVFYSVKGVSAFPEEHQRVITTYEDLRRGERRSMDAVTSVLRAMGRATAPSGVRLEAGRDYAALELGLDPALPWHEALTAISLDDREYYLSCRRRGEKLLGAPRVRLETLHGAKGAQAENVLLLSDLTRRTARGLEEDPDSEHRCFYVGVTRAVERLFVVAPRGRLGYPL